MKYLILIAILFFSCVQAQAPMNDYNLNFQANTDGITQGYEVYFWAGTDTTQADVLANYTRVGYFSHDSLVALYGSALELIDIYPSSKNGEYLKAAARAYGNSLWSAYGFSDAYQKADERPPQTPMLPFISE